MRHGIIAHIAHLPVIRHLAPAHPHHRRRQLDAGAPCVHLAPRQLFTLTLLSLAAPAHSAIAHTQLGSCPANHTSAIATLATSSPITPAPIPSLVSPACPTTPNTNTDAQSLSSILWHTLGPIRPDRLCSTLAVTVSAITIPTLLLRHLLTNSRPTTATAVVTIQAAHRGR